MPVGHNVAAAGMKTSADKVILDRRTVSFGRKCSVWTCGLWSGILTRGRFVWTGFVVGIRVAKHLACFLVNKVIHADDQTNAAAVFDPKIRCKRDGFYQVLVRLVELSQLVRSVSQLVLQLANDVALFFGLLPAL